MEKSFQTLEADLASINTSGTRYNKLNAQVKKIEKLRKRQGVPELAAADVEIVEADDENDD